MYPRFRTSKCIPWRPRDSSRKAAGALTTYLPNQLSRLDLRVCAGDKGEHPSKFGRLQRSKTRFAADDRRFLELLPSDGLPGSYTP